MAAVLIAGAGCRLSRSGQRQVGAPLDTDAMHAAAQRLIGKHDFSSFRAAECQASSPVKTLTDIVVMRHGDDIKVRALAPSFLHHQVRNIVGTLRPFGEGKRSVQWIDKVLKAKDRSAAGATAPAHGLYLLGVGY